MLCIVIGYFGVVRFFDILQKVVELILIDVESFNKSALCCIRFKNIRFVADRANKKGDQTNPQCSRLITFLQYARALQLC